MIFQGQAEVLAETARAANGDDGAAGFEELAEAGNGRGNRDTAASAAIFSGQLLLGAAGIGIFGLRLVTSGRAAAAGTGRRTFAGRNCAVGKDEPVEFFAQATAVELRRINNLKRIFELFQEPARPARRHRAAVAVPQANTHAIQLRRLFAGSGRCASKSRAKLRGDALETRQRRWLGWNKKHAGRVGVTLYGEWLLQAPHFLACSEQAVDGAERIVGFGVQEESRGAGGVENTRWWRQDGPLDRLEWA